jgi:glutathione S-transferase
VAQVRGARALIYPRGMLKLTYFDVRGRTEPIRLLLELTGTPYTYEGIGFAEWRAGPLKARTLESSPFGQLPVMEENGFVLCQAQAILRHLARRLGLAGGTPEEQARVDEVHETAMDMILQISLLHWDEAFATKRAAHRETTKKRLEGLTAFFERRRPDETHWVLEGALTYADVSMAYALESLLVLHPGLVEEHPSLDRAMRAFFAEPGVRAYVLSSRRPRIWTVPTAQFGGKPEETHHFGE